MGGREEGGREEWGSHTRYHQGICLPWESMLSGESQREVQIDSTTRTGLEGSPFISVAADKELQLPSSRTLRWEPWLKVITRVSSMITILLLRRIQCCALGVFEDHMHFVTVSPQISLGNR